MMITRPFWDKVKNPFKTFKYCNSITDNHDKKMSTRVKIQTNTKFPITTSYINNQNHISLDTTQ